MIRILLYEILRTIDFPEDFYIVRIPFLKLILKLICGILIKFKLFIFQDSYHLHSYLLIFSIWSRWLPANNQPLPSMVWYFLQTFLHFSLIIQIYLHFHIFSPIIFFLWKYFSSIFVLKAYDSNFLIFQGYFLISTAVFIEIEDLTHIFSDIVFCKFLINCSISNIVHKLLFKTLEE